MSRFLVIGEHGLDTFHHCKVKRLCPDAPAPIALPYATTYAAGMAANVAANLLSLGAEHVDTILSSPPIEKARYIEESSGYIMLRVDGRQDEDRKWEERGDSAGKPFQIEHLITKLNCAHYDAVVISSYKDYLNEQSIALIAAECSARGILTFADHKLILGEWSRQLTYVKINEREYEAQLVKLGAHPERFCENLVVTFGANGSKHFHGGELAGKVKETHVPVAPVEVSSLSGAGDTFHAAFALMTVKTGGFIAESLDFANRAARVAVSKRGVVAVTAAEVDQSL